MPAAAARGDRGRRNRRAGVCQRAPWNGTGIGAPRCDRQQRRRADGLDDRVPQDRGQGGPEASPYRSASTLVASGGSHDRSVPGGHRGRGRAETRGRAAHRGNGLWADDGQPADRPDRPEPGSAPPTHGGADHRRSWRFLRLHNALGSDGDLQIGMLVLAVLAGAAVALVQAVLGHLTNTLGDPFVASALLFALSGGATAAAWIVRRAAWPRTAGRRLQPNGSWAAWPEP